MASLCTTQIFSPQAALRRISFRGSSRRATYSLWRAPIISPFRARPLTNHVTPGRVATAVGAGLAAVAGAGFGLSSYANLQKLNCEAGSTSLQPPAGAVSGSSQADPMALPPPPESIVNMYELTFGTVCGLCAGVFVKKGAKTLAFVFGGIFVLLQYLSATSLVKVDWARAAARFEGLFYTLDANGTRRPPTVYSLWRRLVDFLTADFQPRASFIAGLALGIRIG